MAAKLNLNDGHLLGDKNAGQRTIIRVYYDKDDHIAFEVMAEGVTLPQACEILGALELIKPILCNEIPLHEMTKHETDMTRKLLDNQ